MKKIYNAIIVDDERLARNELKLLLSDFSEINIIGEAANVNHAIELINQSKPDVLFLDIQLRRETGFDLLDKMNTKCKVIFVTAFDEYALRAFEVNALDYLLKPINKDYLERAIKRLSTSERVEDKKLRKLEYDDRLFLNIDNVSKFLKISTIVCITAMGKYTQIITSGGKKSLVLKSIGEWEKRLPYKYFTRIHRSTIINFEYIEKVEKWFNYTYRVFLHNYKEPFNISRRYATRLKEKLG
jgi:two-component system LytT family response regulator